MTKAKQNCTKQDCFNNQVAIGSFIDWVATALGSGLIFKNCFPTLRRENNGGKRFAIMNLANSLL